MRDLSPLFDGTLLRGRILQFQFASTIRLLRRICNREISSDSNAVENAWSALDVALYEYVDAYAPFKIMEYAGKYGLTYGMRYPPRHPTADDASLFLGAQRSGLPKIGKCIEEFSRVGCLALIGLHEARAGRVKEFYATYSLVARATRYGRRGDIERGRKVLQGTRSGAIARWGSQKDRKQKSAAIVEMYERVEREHPHIKSHQRRYEITSERLQKSGMEAVSVPTVKRHVIESRRRKGVQS